MRPLTTPVNYTIPFNLETMPQRFASIGSCFSEKIVELLSHAGFECLSNPNGIVYNPYSIEQSVRHISEDRPYDAETFFLYNDLYHSREHHGKFSGETLSEVMEKAENERKRFRKFLKEPCPVALTFGTAVVFREKNTGKIVANCHKVPGTEFERELLTVSCCRELIANTVELLTGSGDHPVILSVSPVRHHPGDPVLNSRSKAILIEACHEAEESCSGKCAYFPGFELLHDELRDYRFYADDLVHPSAAAEEFILENFMTHCYGSKAKVLLDIGWKNIKRSRHVPGGLV